MRVNAIAPGLTATARVMSGYDEAGRAATKEHKKAHRRVTGREKKSPFALRRCSGRTAKYLN